MGIVVNAHVVSPVENWTHPLLQDGCLFENGRNLDVPGSSSRAWRVSWGISMSSSTCLPKFQAPWANLTRLKWICLTLSLNPVVYHHHCHSFFSNTQTEYPTLDIRRLEQIWKGNWIQAIPGRCWLLSISQSLDFLARSFNDWNLIDLIFKYVYRGTSQPPRILMISIDQQLAIDK